MSYSSTSGISQLSVYVHELSGGAIPFACLEGIWRKASDLLQHSENVVSAPGCDPAARLVDSCTGKRPHLVLPTKGGFK